MLISCVLKVECDVSSWILLRTYVRRLWAWQCYCTQWPGRHSAGNIQIRFKSTYFVTVVYAIRVDLIRWKTVMCHWHVFMAALC